MMGNVEQNIGMYRKFQVSRNDGRDALGQKHWGCDYFVLDWSHDPHALVAIAAYADSCEADFPKLARDLRLRLPLAENEQRIRADIAAEEVEDE